MSDQSFTQRFISILTVFWGIYLIPTILMLILTLRGQTVVVEASGPGQQLLYWTVVSYPFVLGFAIAASWLSYKHKQYLLAKIFALLPLVSILLELIAADLLLL